MKTAITIIIVIILAGAGLLFYVSRPVAAPSETPAPASSVAGDAVSGTVAYQIAQERSSVSFEINEVLRGKPFTVVGTTSSVSGEIAIGPDGAPLSFGELRINARTLKTDDTQRDGALARLILKSESPENEFVVFKPTQVIGAPERLENGDVTVIVSGDLTISDVTKPATFAVEMTVGDDEVTGTARAALKRSDFNLVIPNIPFVANVTDEFTVTADIVAVRTMQ